MKKKRGSKSKLTTSNPFCNGPPKFRFEATEKRVKKKATCLFFVSRRRRQSWHTRQRRESHRVRRRPLHVPTASRRPSSCVELMKSAAKWIDTFPGGPGGPPEAVGVCGFIKTLFDFVGPWTNRRLTGFSSLLLFSPFPSIGYLVLPSFFFTYGSTGGVVQPHSSAAVEQNVPGRQRSSVVVVVVDVVIVVVAVVCADQSECFKTDNDRYQPRRYP